MGHNTRQNPAVRGRAISLVLFCAFALAANAGEIHPPAAVQAGEAFSIPIEGSGEAAFYLIGPDRVVKRTVNLGGDLQIQSNDVRAAGQYRVVVCQSSCTSATFEVRAAQPAHLSFFLHPSRVPVSLPGAIDATVFVFDRYFNLVMSPSTVDFRITPASAVVFSRQSQTHSGVTWMRMDSTPREGRVEVTAALGPVQEARVIQQVAADACGLHMKAVPSGSVVTLETDPVHDCSGNALPDGTIVSFTKVDEDGRSTVDTPIKKGVARTQFRVAGPARISIACGVVLGNEIALNGKL
jgi:hypothetical protein